MALIPFVPFTSGAVFTPEIANAIAVPVFDGQPQYFGHLPKIKDTDLDDSASSVLSRVANNELNLKVTAGSGLNALVASGRVLIGTTIFNIGNSSLSVTASSLNYIYIDSLGVLRSSVAIPPIIRALLALVTTNTTGVIGVTDTREGYKVEVVKPLTTTIRNFGGRGDSGAFLAVGGEVLNEGEYYFTDFTVPLGVTVTIGKLARIYCSGRALIAGSIFVTGCTAGAPALAVRGFQVAGGSGSGFGGGQGETPAETYNHILAPVGSGGGGGYFVSQNTGNAGFTSKGGIGGGCFWLECAGSIEVSGSISANGGSGDLGNYSGDAGNYIASGGGGGGSGGLIILKSLVNTIVSGLLSVTGGNGGRGFSVASPSISSEDGSGGGGGRVVIYSPAINTTSSVITLAGGVPGNGWSSQGLLLNAIGGTGGSYGGIGGTQTGNGVAGGVGIITLKYFIPVG